MSSASSIEYLRSGGRGSWASRETDRLAVVLLSSSHNVNYLRFDQRTS